MTKFDPALHPRERSGTFAEKVNSAPTSHLMDGVIVASEVGDLSRDGETTTTHSITGVLADRIRARLPHLSADAGVVLTEVAEEWGTDWTKENARSFTIAVGPWSQTFYPDTSSTSWSDAAVHNLGADSVFARFDAWLRAGDSPEALREEWFEPDAETCDWWVRYRALPGTILTRTAARHCRRGRVAELNLEMLPAEARTARGAKFHDGGKVMWRADLVGARDSSGFAAILERIDLNEIGSTRDIADAISALTDRLMPGSPPL